MKTPKPITKKQQTERHLGMPWTEWQTKKRQEWRALQQALSAFEFGAAYTPVGPDLYAIRQCVDRIAEAMERDWVAW